jgi:hypothetical protein
LIKKCNGKNREDDSAKDNSSAFSGDKETAEMASIGWRDNWAKALEEAKKTNRPLLLEFYMDG